MAAARVARFRAAAQALTGAVLSSQAGLCWRRYKPTLARSVSVVFALGCQQGVGAWQAHAGVFWSGQQPAQPAPTPALTPALSVTGVFPAITEGWLDTLPNQECLYLPESIWARTQKREVFLQIQHELRQFTGPMVIQDRFISGREMRFLFGSHGLLAGAKRLRLVHCAIEVGALKYLPTELEELSLEQSWASVSYHLVEDKASIAQSFLEVLRGGVGAHARFAHLTHLNLTASRLTRGHLVRLLDTPFLPSLVELNVSGNYSAQGLRPGVIQDFLLRREWPNFKAQIFDQEASFLWP